MGPPPGFSPNLRPDFIRVGSAPLAASGAGECPALYRFVCSPMPVTPSSLLCRRRVLSVAVGSASLGLGSSRREKQAGIWSEPNIDTYMKAISVEGLERNLQTDYILKIMGMDIFADMMIGDAMRRGISGGQKKRLTAGGGFSSSTDSEKEICFHKKLKSKSFQAFLKCASFDPIES